MSWFNKVEISANITLFQERLDLIEPEFLTQYTNIYLICGSKKAILFDTGSGSYQLSTEINKIWDIKELIVINSHSHFDHIGSNSEFKEMLNKITMENFNSNELIENVSNYQIYLNKEKLKELRLNVHNVSQIIADEIINFNNVYKSITALSLQNSNFDFGILKTLQNGYNQKFSGDILFVPNPSTISSNRTGTTHGSGYSYDTHVPLIFYGNGIKKGQSDNYYPIIDIAPTITSFLKITQANGNTGKPIIEVLK